MKTWDDKPVSEMNPEELAAAKNLCAMVCAIRAAMTVGWNKKQFMKGASSMWDAAVITDREVQNHTVKTFSKAPIGPIQ